MTMAKKLGRKEGRSVEDRWKKIKQAKRGKINTGKKERDANCYTTISRKKNRSLY